MAGILSPFAIRRVIDDLARGELKTPIGGDGSLGEFDSIDILKLAGAVNSLFRLHDLGTEERLLGSPTVDGWAEIVHRGLAAPGRRLTFRTSGSTGRPKEVAHSVAHLRREIEELSRLFPGCSRIVGTVSSSHIFGFLFTAALPEAIGAEFVDARSWSAAEWSTALRPGDLIVSHPLYWAYLDRFMQRFVEGVSGVSSTAPISAEVVSSLLTKGLLRMYEVYGSTESAGVGVRVDHDQPFQLMAHWRVLLDPAPPRIALDEKIEGLTDDDRRPVPLPDRIEWLDDRRFRPVGRIDGAVQIAGVNVYPGRVESRLKEAPGVIDVHVRAMNPDEGDRLKAAIVLADFESDERARIERELEAWIIRELSAPERPKSVVYLQSLPRDANGKPIDWHG